MTLSEIVVGVEEAVTRFGGQLSGDRSARSAMSRIWSAPY